MQVDPQPDLQRLLERQCEIQRAMRRPGGIRITVERELYAIDEQLKRYRRALVQGADGLAGAGKSIGAGSPGAHAAHAANT
jgi:hypothetical protein